jgi:hypothetical protein
MTEQQIRCQCPPSGHLDCCPLAWIRGSQHLHLIEHEKKTQARVFQPLSIANRSPDSRAVFDHDQASPDDDPGQNSGSYSPGGDNWQDYQAVLKSTDATNLGRGKDRSLNNRAGTAGGNELNDASVMMRKEYRGQLSKFEPLMVGEESITKLSIGGFKVDLSMAAQKASEVAPLPASKLPIIFADSELNFYHHFYQGMTSLIGNQLMIKITTTDTHRRDENEEIVRLVFRLVKEGYRPSDTELSVFTKKVLMSTFDRIDHGNSDESEIIFVVSANLWGFQYIESGMQLRDADMRMWLQINFNHYKTLWFNTFKSAGIPSFANAGVRSTESEPRSAEEHLPRSLIQLCAGPASTHSRTEQEHLENSTRPGARHRNHRDGRKKHGTKGMPFAGFNF